MADTDDFTSLVAQVRAFIPDIEKIVNPNRPGSEAEYIFTDAHLQALVDANGGNPRLAAADAVELLGTTEAFILKVVSSEDLQTDGAKLLNAYIIRAAQMRKTARDELNDQGSFDIVPFFVVPTHYEPVA
jgi:hypothetical protein